MNNGGPAPNGRGRMMESKVGDGYLPVAGRPAPINTTIAHVGQGGCPTAVTASSSVYSPSAKTGSSVQYTPAISMYTPSIWSSGVGTPMSVSETPRSASMKSSTSQDTPLASQTQPSAPIAAIEQLPVPAMMRQDNGRAPLRGTDGHLSSMYSHEARANGAQAHPRNMPGPGSVVLPVHFERNDVNIPYTVTYFDKNGVPRQNAFPLSRQSDGKLVDANAQLCQFPRKAEVLSKEKGTRMTGTVKPDSPSNTAAPPGANLKAKINAVDQNASDPTQDRYKNKKKLSTSSKTTPESPHAIHSTPEEDIFSPHYTQTQPELDNIRVPFWKEEVNGDNLKAQLKQFRPLFREAMPNAIKTTLGLGSEFFRMSWGSRAVCIKVDDVRNVHWAIQHGACVVMDKVGERITKLLNEGKSRDDHVWLLFSVNKQKSYCGLARLSGPWFKTNNIAGWVGADGAKVWGVLPIEWRYIKNVSYDYFQEISNSRSGQPITNMWNGMHFPFNEGREVLKTFIETTGFTNVICWRGDRVYNPYMEVTHAAQLDPRLRTKPNDMTLFRMTHGIKKPSSRTADEDSLKSKSSGGKAKPQTPAHRPNEHDSVTPMPPVTQLYRGAITEKAKSAPSSFDGPASPSPLPGQRVECIVDEHGNYIPVTPNNHAATATTKPRGPSGFTPKHQAPNFNRGVQPNQNRVPFRGYGGQRAAQDGHPPGRPSFPVNVEGANMRHPGFAHGTPRASAMMNTAPSQLHCPAPSNSAHILRQAVSKDNFFVPKHLEVSGKLVATLPIEKTPSHFQGIEHALVSQGFSSTLKAFSTAPVHPHSTDGQSSVESADRDSYEYDRMAAEIDMLVNSFGNGSEEGEGDGESEEFPGGVSLE